MEETTFQTVTAHTSDIQISSKVEILSKTELMELEVILSKINTNLDDFRQDFHEYCIQNQISIKNEICNTTSLGQDLFLEESVQVFIHHLCKDPNNEYMRESYGIHRINYFQNPKRTNYEILCDKRLSIFISNDCIKSKYANTRNKKKKNNN